MKTYTNTQLLDLAIAANRKGLHDVALWLRTLASIPAHSVTLTEEGMAVIESI